MDLQNQLNLLPKPGTKVRVFLYQYLGHQKLPELPDGILETTVVSRQIWSGLGGHSSLLSLADGSVFSPTTEEGFKDTFCRIEKPDKELSFRARIIILDEF